jgi:hypothetical protein
MDPRTIIQEIEQIRSAPAGDRRPIRRLRGYGFAFCFGPCALVETVSRIFGMMLSNCSPGSIWDRDFRRILVQVAELIP